MHKSLFLTLVLLLAAQLCSAQQAVRVPWLHDNDTTHPRKVTVRELNPQGIQTSATFYEYDQHGYLLKPYSPLRYDSQGRLVSRLSVEKCVDGLRFWLDTIYSLSVTYHPQYNLPQEGVESTWIHENDNKERYTTRYTLIDCKADKQHRITDYRYLKTYSHLTETDTIAYHCVYNKRGQIVERRITDGIDGTRGHHTTNYYNSRGLLSSSANLYYECYDSLTYIYEGNILTGWTGHGWSEGDECDITVRCTPDGTPISKVENWFEYDWNEDGSRFISNRRTYRYEYDSHGNAIRLTLPDGSLTLWQIEYWQ